MKDENNSTDFEQELNEIPIFLDTTSIIPGMKVYVIEKVPANPKTPYITFRAVPRIVSQVHSTGINNGTTFFSYKPILKTDIGTQKKVSVEVEETVFYSPLTKEQAELICKQLNLQMKHFYEKNIAKIKGIQNNNIKSK